MEPGEMDVLSDSKEILGNRTGIMTNPELSIEMIEGAKQTVPSSQGDATEMAAVKAITGEIPFRGKLPISLPGLYPVGHGLTR